VQPETNVPAASAGYATVNPFIITQDADGLIDFLKQVFGATERPEARTLDDDGLLLHAELAVGNATVMFAERKPGWPFTPSLLQVYVDDVDATLDLARADLHPRHPAGRDAGAPGPAVTMRPISDGERRG
jgi:PhnB protein